MAHTNRPPTLEVIFGPCAPEWGGRKWGLFNEIQWFCTSSCIMCTTAFNTSSIQKMLLWRLWVAPLPSVLPGLIQVQYRNCSCNHGGVIWHETYVFIPTIPYFCSLWQWQRSYLSEPDFVTTITHFQSVCNNYTLSWCLSEYFRSLLYTYIYIYIYTYAHTHTLHTYIHTYIHT